MTIRSVVVPLMFAAAAVMFTGVASAGEKKGHDKLPRAEVQLDKALIYVLRPAAAGFAVPMYFFANDRFLGVNHGNGYFWVYVDPGKYIFWTKSENVDVMEVAVEAGKTYYFKQKTVMGVLKARTSLVLLDEAAGDATIDDCKKVSETTDEQRQRGAKHLEESWERAQKEAAESTKETH